MQFQKLETLLSKPVRDFIMRYKKNAAVCNSEMSAVSIKDFVYRVSKISVFLIIGSCISLSASAQTSGTSISSLQFTDSNLADCVSDTAASNGWTTVGQMDELDCFDSGIASAEGIEQLIALQWLTLWRNSLTEIDLSSNTSLYYLDLDENQLTSIDVTANTLLEFFFISDNFLTEIDVSENTLLFELDVQDNFLTSLNTSSNPELEFLDAKNNLLTTIDVTANNALEFLDATDNLLTTIDVTSNTALNYLELDGNQIAQIDVSNNTALLELDLDNNELTEIDVSANTALVELDLGNNNLSDIDLSSNPALEELDLDKNEFTEVDLSANTALIEVELIENQISDIDFSNNPNLELIDLRENPLTEENRDYLDTITANDVTTLTGYEASLDGNVITFPAVNVGDAAYEIDLTLVDDTNPPELKLTYAEEVPFVDNFAVSTFTDSTLYLPVLMVGETSYWGEFAVASESPVVFKLNEAEVNDAGEAGISGKWSIRETVHAAECEEDTYIDSYSLEVTQSGSDFTVTASVGVFSGSLVGDTLQWSGSYNEDGGTIETSLAATFSSRQDSLSGTSTWTFSSSAGNCSGTSEFTGRLLHN